MEEVKYLILDENMTCVVYTDCTKDYAPPTHAEHEILGTVTGGKILVSVNGTENVFCSGESFPILGDELHSIRSADGKPYSMTIWCIKTEFESGKKDAKLEELKKAMLDNPDEEFTMDDLSEISSVSKFHMIRRFKEKIRPYSAQIPDSVQNKACPKTHRGRNVPPLRLPLRQDFFDQSHFNRNFTKLLGMTPSQYKKSL